MNNISPIPIGRTVLEDHLLNHLTQEEVLCVRASEKTLDSIKIFGDHLLSKNQRELAILVNHCEIIGENDLPLKNPEQVRVFEEMKFVNQATICSSLEYMADWISRGSPFVVKKWLLFENTHRFHRILAVPLMVNNKIPDQKVFLFRFKV